MNELRQDIPALAMPLSMLLLVWMAVGRGFFVPIGWMTVLIVFASPALAICLWTTSRMVRQRGRELTSGQARAQLTLWAAMLVFGLTCLDGTDASTTPSILMKLLGEGTVAENVSGVLWYGSIFVGIAAWIRLHGRLSKAIAVPPPAQQPYPYPGQSGPGPSN